METIRYVEGDHYPSAFQVKDDDGAVVDLSSASTITMEIILDGATVATTSLACTITSPTIGGIEVVIPSTVVSGMYRIKWVEIDVIGSQISYPTSEVQWLRVMSRYGV